MVEALGAPDVFIYRELPCCVGEPWLIGGYFDTRHGGVERQRPIWSLWVGLGAVALSCLAASRISYLDSSKVGMIRGSAFCKLNDQTTAFNGCLRGLRWFEVYVSSG